MIGWNLIYRIKKKKKRAIRERSRAGESCTGDSRRDRKKAEEIPFQEPTKQQKAEAVEHADTSQETIRPELINLRITDEHLGKADRSRNFVPIWKR